MSLFKNILERSQNYPRALCSLLLSPIYENLIKEKVNRLTKVCCFIPLTACINKYICDRHNGIALAGQVDLRSTCPAGQEGKNLNIRPWTQPLKLHV